MAVLALHPTRPQRLCSISGMKAGQPRHRRSSMVTLNTSIATLFHIKPIGIISSSLPYFDMNIAAAVLALNTTNSAECITNGHSSLLAKPVDYSIDNLSDTSKSPLGLPGNLIHISNIFDCMNSGLTRQYPYCRGCRCSSYKCYLQR